MDRCSMRAADVARLATKDVTGTVTALEVFLRPLAEQSFRLLRRWGTKAVGEHAVVAAAAAAATLAASAGGRSEDSCARDSPPTAGGSRAGGGPRRIASMREYTCVRATERWPGG